MAGSLLGLTRAGKPIAHEHDIDLGIDARDVAKARLILINAT